MEGSKEGEKHSKDTELPTTTGGQRVSLKGLLRIKALLGLILNKIIQKKKKKKKTEELHHSQDLFECTWPNRSLFVFLCA